MSEISNDQITLFIREEKTGRYAFNAKALRALGIDRQKHVTGDTRSNSSKNPRQTWLTRRELTLVSWVPAIECRLCGHEFFTLLGLRLKPALLLQHK